MAEDKKPIGRILLKRRLITQEELETQLEQQRAAHDGVPLASRLAASGVVKENDVLRALSEQHGVPGVDLSRLAIKTEHLDLVPREVAESSRILPVLASDDRLFLAMANPHDKKVVDEIEFVTGRKIYPYVAVTSTLEKTIRAAYDAKEAGEAAWVASNAPPDALQRIGAEPKRQEHDSMAPGSSAVVVDEQIESAALSGQISTGDFGELGEEVSKLNVVPEDLRRAATLEAGIAKPAPEGAKKVLVVDDEDEIRRLVTRLLSEKGHRVIEADRGLTALRLVKEETPDLILLDAMLPELHGFDIARRLKGSEKYGSIPILMMSAVYRGWRIAEDLKTNYGIEDYIEKPFRIAEMLRKVERLLEQAASGAPSRDPEQINRNAAKYLDEGIAAYKAGETDLAVAMLRKGISVDPLAYRLRYHLALIYGKQGQFYDGITELERAVDLNPKHFAALKNLAVLYEKAGFKNKAVEMWERCIHVAPDAETRDSIKGHVLKLL